jgi:hypothetical protein
MSADRDRLELMLSRLRELELQLPLPHERPILETARLALREEASRLAHALHDLSYWQDTRTRKHAG